MTKYSEYLKTYQWKRLKDQAILKAGNKCQLCGSRHNLVIHHTKYPEILGTETIDDLQCLCETCHNVKCHNGSPSNNKIRLSKQEKRRRKDMCFILDRLRLKRLILLLVTTTGLMHFLLFPKKRYRLVASGRGEIFLFPSIKQTIGVPKTVIGNLKAHGIY